MEVESKPKKVSVIFEILVLYTEVRRNNILTGDFIQTKINEKAQEILWNTEKRFGNVQYYG